MRKFIVRVIAASVLMGAVTACTSSSSGSVISSSAVTPTTSAAPTDLSTTSTPTESTSPGPSTAAPATVTTTATVTATPASSTPPIVAEVLTPVLASATVQPVPVRGTDGRTFLAYELSVINGVSLPVIIDSVVVLDESSHAILQSYSGAELVAHFRGIGNVPTATAPSAVELKAGQVGFIWLDPSVASGRPVPKGVIHQLKFHYPKAPDPLLPARITETVAAATVRTKPAPTITPPLSGVNWLDGNGCCDEVTAHRAAGNPVNGAYFFAERFAIDWVQLDAQNRLFTGDPTKLSSYKYYDAPIHAVSDGVVVAVQDNLKDEVPGANPPVGSLTLPQYGGNYVVEKFEQDGETYYAFYAHLAPRSATKYSRVGQIVKAGDIIGLLGNSGNTDFPHLHFHVMNTPNPLASEGLPYQFDSVDLQGVAAGDAAIQSLVAGKPMPLAPNGPKGTRTDELPLYLDLVTTKAA